MPQFEIRISSSHDSKVADIRAFCDSHWIRIYNKKTGELLLFSTPWWIPAIGVRLRDEWNKRTGIITVSAESGVDLAAEAVPLKKRPDVPGSFRNPFFVNNKMQFNVWAMEDSTHQVFELLDLKYEAA